MKMDVDYIFLPQTTLRWCRLFLNVTKWQKPPQGAGEAFSVPKAGIEPARLLKDIGFWVQRVYQFRHSGISGNRNDKVRYFWRITKYFGTCRHNITSIFPEIMIFCYIRMDRNIQVSQVRNTAYGAREGESKSLPRGEGFRVRVTCT